MSITLVVITDDEHAYTLSLPHIYKQKKTEYVEMIKH